MPRAPGGGGKPTGGEADEVRPAWADLCIEHLRRQVVELKEDDFGYQEAASIEGSHRDFLGKKYEQLKAGKWSPDPRK